MGTITTANFKSMTDTCDREIEEAKRVISELEEDLFTKEEFQKHIAEIRSRLEASVKEASNGIIGVEFVSQYIDKIIVSIENPDTARLEIKIFTGKNTEKWLSRLKAKTKGRMGNTSLKMKPIRTLSFERPSRILEEHKAVHTYQFNLIV